MDAQALTNDIDDLVALRPGLKPTGRPSEATYAFAGVTLRVYWDTQLPDDHGWAWETTGMASTDSGSINTLDDLDKVLATVVDTSPSKKVEMEDQGTEDYETGQRIFAAGLPMTYCECSGHEFGWESAADEQQEHDLETMPSIFVNI